MRNFQISRLQEVLEDLISGAAFRQAVGEHVLGITPECVANFMNQAFLSERKYDESLRSVL
eukprot:3857863-Pyramimonas_sp.AAC.1